MHVIARRCVLTAKKNNLFKHAGARPGQDALKSHASQFNSDTLETEQLC
jgi:hypothetical protein